MPVDTVDRWRNVDAAFSRQSLHFDEDDFSNPILQAWRQRVYTHVDQFLKPHSKILELNCGTGIDAIRLASQGHTIHATDISGGMLSQLKQKISLQSLQNKITVEQLPFDQLDKLNGKFDYVFSNFGGLNCIDDLKKVTMHLPPLLNQEAFVTWVIMPRITPWEWTWALKAKFKDAFRRFTKDGVNAHLEGEFFKTHYFSLSEIRESFGAQFQLIRSEALGVFSPPPAAMSFVKRFPFLSDTLNGIDQSLANVFPFNRWGDHTIVTFQKR